MIRAPKFLYPKFYIKAVGGQYSIIHRLTHCYIETAKSEDELVERVKYWVGLEDKELWRYMVKECYQPIPREKSLIFYQQNKKDEEEWFISAWSVYTDKFYDKHPELFVEEKEFPIEAIREFQREEYKRQREEDERAKREREEAERRYKDEERKAKEKKKVEEVQEGKIGSISAIEKLKRKARKNIKKVKAKANSIKQIVIIDSDDLFA